MSKDYDEIVRLASKFYDNALSDKEFERLNELLKDQSNRELFSQLGYVNYCLQNSARSADSDQIASQYKRIAEAILPERDSTSVQSSVPTSLPDRITEVIQSRLSGYSSAVLAASILLFVTALLFWFAGGREGDSVSSADQSESQEEPIDTEQAESDVVVVGNDATAHGFVGKIVAVTNELVWEPTGVPQDVLLRVGQGDRISITQGLLKIQFTSDATLILEGPADLEILSDQSCRLWYGTAICQSELADFTLLTPQAQVIDIGTEFGVAVKNQGDTLVKVFDGEVHVKSSEDDSKQANILRLTTGMTVGINTFGTMSESPEEAPGLFRRELRFDNNDNLGANELSLVDVLTGSIPGERRPAAAINPTSGAWDQTPWSQLVGVDKQPDRNRLVAVPWNDMVDSVFIPPSGQNRIRIDSVGHEIDLDGFSGVAWGPIWARRRTNGDLDPLGLLVEKNIGGFWGAGTIPALHERLYWVRDGIVGMHANVGFTIDLGEVRNLYGRSLRKLRGVVTLLERSHESQPFQPDALADFRIFVDGQPRNERIGFSRSEGDAQFGILLNDRDHYLTLIVTDGGDEAVFDRVVLLDPVFELEPKE